MPHNTEAERALLGSVLLDNAALAISIEIVSVGDFYSTANRLCFEKMLQLSEKGTTIDLVTLSDQLTKDGLFDKAGGGGYIAGLTEGVPIGTTAAVGEYCHIVKEKSKLRSIINASNNVLARAFEGIDDSATLAELGIEALYDIIGAKQKSGLVKLDQVFREEMGAFGTLLDGRTGAAYGIPTGFTDLDAMCRGLQPGELTIIAARPSLGKTALATCIALNMADRYSIPVGFFSLEMMRAALLTRMLCVNSRINIHRLSTGFSTRDDVARAVKGIGELAKLPIWIDDTSGLTLTSFRAKAKRLIQEQGARGFIVDYIQLMSSGKKFDSRNAEVGYLSAGLKQFAKDEKVFVVALSQLSREPEKGRKRKPRLSDLRESGALEQDTDVVIFLWRPKQDESTAEGGQEMVTIIIGKQRNGPTGELCLGFQKEYTRFVNLASGSDEPEIVSVP